MAQNPYFVPFHTGYVSLYQQLSQTPGLTLEETGRQETLIARLPHSEISYRFHQDSIYRIEVKNDYFRKKDALTTYESCRKYFQKIGAREAAFFVEGNAQHIIAVKGGNTYELIYAEHQKDVLSVSLIAKCVRFTPSEELSAYDFLADM